MAKGQGKRWLIDMGWPGWKSSYEFAGRVPLMRGRIALGHGPAQSLRNDRLATIHRQAE
jgi:hypothetical protein